MKLTSHERIMRIFQNKEVDRPALKLWGLALEDGAVKYPAWMPKYDVEVRHPAYLPVRARALEISDLFIEHLLPLDNYKGVSLDKYLEEKYVPAGNGEWVDVYRILHTPKGDLQMVRRDSTGNQHGLVLEHWVKEPEDLECLLSMEFEPYHFDRSYYDALVKRVGDRGVVITRLPMPSYALYQLLGSETLAYFSIDYREELIHALDVLTERFKTYIGQILDAGVKGPFGFMGHETFIPPLMRPEDFHDFVYKTNKPLYDMIHERGGNVWVHCHGKVANFIDSFIDMGVDVLNPLEPPKNGDIHMGDIVARYGNRIGWEGNIECQDLVFGSPERVRELIDECVRYGSASGRFILGTCSGYAEEPDPSERYINNLFTYLNYGLEAVERYRR